MNYFKYIFSDKKAFKFWILIYILIFIPVFLGMAMDFGVDGKLDEYQLTSLIIYFIFWSLAFILFYTIGYYNFKRQERFLKKYAKHIDSSYNLEREVEVFRNSYNVKGFRTNYEARIKPKSKRDIFKVGKIDHLIFMIGQTYDLGVFKREFCPIVVDINDYKNPKKYRYAINPKISTANWIDNDLEIIFKSSVYGIRKVKLFNWKK